ncbi:MAG: peptidoglycan D,D-transpeptidase FtsI family protein [Actinomycetota bacterium]
MTFRLVVLQVVESHAYAKIAADQRERVIEFPARRGVMFDRNGDALAMSVDLNMVYTDHIHVDDIEETARKLAPLLDVPAAELEKKLVPSVPGDQFEYLAHEVEPRVARRIKAMKIPGIYMKPEPKRYYPGGRLASHVLGFVNLDGTVQAGLERQYQSILRGEPGRMMLEQDPTGRALPQAEFSYEAPEPGQSLFLTIDKELQYFTEMTLAEAVRRYHAEAGTAIVMHVGTGEVLALANTPDFDPNDPGDASQDTLRNRAVTDVYEPGSAFKIVTLAAALEERVVTPKTSYPVPDAFQYVDRVFNDSHSHATETMTVAEIIQQSSNVGTIKMGLEVGGQKLDEYIRRFGFGARTGLDFPGETPGIVLPRKLWSGTTIATLPIGQGIAVTPLQMVSAYAAIANGGKWVEPKLLHSTMGSQGRMKLSPPAATRRVVSTKTARKVTKILEGVVEDGTGTEALVPGYNVAGKTGTAQKPLPGGGYGNSYIGSFAGFAPAGDPQVVVLVKLDEPSPIWGGSTAAPTFQTIMEYTMRHLKITPSTNAARAAEAIEEAQAEDPAAHD